MPVELPPSDHLPAGFGWRWHDLRPTLFYGHHALASFDLADQAYRVLTGQQHARQPPRAVVVTTPALAIRYCESYVRRWEGRIRRELGDLLATNGAIGPVLPARFLEEDGLTSRELLHRRRRSGR